MTTWPFIIIAACGTSQLRLIWATKRRSHGLKSTPFESNLMSALFGSCASPESVFTLCVCRNCCRLRSEFPMVVVGRVRLGDGSEATFVGMSGTVGLVGADVGT